MHTEQQTPPLIDASLDNLSDEAIVEQVCKGHTALYELIMRRYNQRLFRIARSILPDDAAAQDAMQEAYISAYYNLDRYQPSGKLGAWLSRITVNEALMIKRKPDSKLAQQSQTQDASQLESGHTGPAEHTANQELAGLIEYAIDCLPSEFRCVFMLRGIQQLSVSETAASLGLNESTVKTRYLRAREKMQKTLDKHIHEAGLQAFEFAGHRCDRMVRNVLTRIIQAGANAHSQDGASLLTH